MTTETPQYAIIDLSRHIAFGPYETKQEAGASAIGHIYGASMIMPLMSQESLVPTHPQPQGQLI